MGLLPLLLRCYTCMRHKHLHQIPMHGLISAAALHACAWTVLWLHTGYGQASTAACECTCCLKLAEVMIVVAAVPSTSLRVPRGELLLLLLSPDCARALGPKSGREILCNCPNL
jgi:hypothetical protein